MSTFAELYCARSRQPLAAFTPVVLRRCLRPHARLLRPVLEFAHPGFFDADVDFVSSVGNLTSLRDFSLERTNFHHHPGNRNPLRSLLRLRISSARLRRLAEEAFAQARGTSGPAPQGNPPPAPTRSSEPDGARGSAVNRQLVGAP